MIRYDTQSKNLIIITFSVVTGTKKSAVMMILSQSSVTMGFATHLIAARVEKMAFSTVITFGKFQEQVRISAIQSGILVISLRRDLLTPAAQKQVPLDANISCTYSRQCCWS